MKPSKAQAAVISEMQKGATLTWYGSNGPEISTRPFWPSKATVRAMLAKGLLKWGEYRNRPQREAGIQPLELAT